MFYHMTPKKYCACDSCLPASIKYFATFKKDVMVLFITRIVLHVYCKN